MADPKQRLKAAPLSLMGLTDSLLEDEPREVVVYQENPNALTRREGGGWQYKRFALLDTGVEIPADITLPELEDVAQAIRELENPMQWWVGDIFASIEIIEGETYKEIAARLGYETKTVRDYAYVCRKLSIRIDGVSFRHHQVVIGLSPEWQEKWLRYAADSGVSAEKLRQEIIKWQVGDTPKPRSIILAPDQKSIRRLLALDGEALANLTPAKRKATIQAARDMQRVASDILRKLEEG